MMDKEFIDDFSRLQILQLYACGKCGECNLACPVFEETQDINSSPAFRIRLLKSIAKSKYGIRAFLFGSRNVDQDEVKNFASSLYFCTLCGRCMTVCPYNFDLVDIWEKARERVFEKDLAPKPIISMIDSTLTEKNFLNRPHVKRGNWMRRLDVREERSAETLYFVGCSISYIPSLRVVAKGVSKILNSAKEDWTTFSEEWCCGLPLKFGGGTEKFKEFVIHNVEKIEALGSKRVVFSCPGCYRMFKYEYPKVLGRQLKFSMLHITELVNDYLKNGKIRLKKLEKKITYHDPCELGRLLGIIEQPRNVLAALSTSFLELPENKLNSLCCGGGGLYKGVDTDNSLAIAKKRILQTETIGSELLISACPSCIMNLHQARRFMKSNVKVVDFADAIAKQIEDV